MKKLVLLLILLVAFTNPLHAQAQSINWVTLQSDITSLTSPGQPILLTLKGSLNTSISGAALVLNYDPACFKITGHQPGTLLPNATAFVQEKPGQIDITYYFLGSVQGLTGEGSLISIQLETLKMCTSDLSTTPENITLGILDDKGMAFNLPGVEYRSLSIHLAPDAGLLQPAINVPAISPADVAESPTASQNTFNAYPILLFMTILVAISLAGYFLLGRQSRGNLRQLPVTKTFISTHTPALVHNGQPIRLLQKRMQLGRHAEIIQREGITYLVDNGNPKGTFLNGNRIGSGYHPLHNGDQVQLGQGASYRFSESGQRR